MILITGANGHLGSGVIDFLQRKHPDVKPVALVRSEEKGRALKERGIGLRIGDYFNLDSLRAAMEGIDTLLFISSSNLQDRMTQHGNVIEAANTSGVGHIIYTSILHAADASDNPIGSDHYQTEERIVSTGIPFTFFRNSFYADVLPMFMGPALETGQWAYASGDEKVNFVVRMDIAEALAEVLADPEPHKKTIYEITGPEAYSFTQLARMLSDVVGRTIVYTELPLDVLESNLEKAGLDEQTIAGAMAVAEVIRSGLLNAKDPVLGQLLGRRPTDMGEYLRQSVGKKNVRA
ncbi:MAG: SDR family oxidoreductase [Acidobacteriota bacterium]